MELRLRRSGLAICVSHRTAAGWGRPALSGPQDQTQAPRGHAQATGEAGRGPSDLGCPPQNRSRI